MDCAAEPASPPTHTCNIIRHLRLCRDGFEKRTELAPSMDILPSPYELFPHTPATPGLHSITAQTGCAQAAEPRINCQTPRKRVGRFPSYAAH